LKTRWARSKLLAATNWRCGRSEILSGNPPGYPNRCNNAPIIRSPFPGNPDDSFACRFHAVCRTFALLLGACSSQPQPATSVGIANSASEHCLKKGGKLEIVKEASSEKGMCHLPDGTVIEEWTLFRRDNP